MTHILADLDNKSRYLATHDGRNYFLRVLIMEESIRKFPQALDLYTHLLTDVSRDLDKQLRKREGEKRQHLPELGDLSEAARKWCMEDFPKIFDGANNRTFFLVEDEAGEAVSIMHLTINDESLMARIKINDEDLGRRLAIPHVDTFIFVDDLVTAEPYRGSGLFTLAFDKALSMIRKRTMESAECEDGGVMDVCISMSAFKAVRDVDGAEVYHVANLPAYNHVLTKRFGDNIIYRDRDKLRPGSGDSFGARRMAEYLVEGRLSEEKISRQIADEIPAASERADAMIAGGERIRSDGVGAYISAVSNISYEQLAGERKIRRGEKFQYEKTTAKGDGWKSYTGPSSGGGAGAGK